MPALADPLILPRGPAWPNRFALAPMTNQQSAADGRLLDAEHDWLMMRAAGGFGMTMTCAAHVQPNGQGFAGQLGVFGDEHVEGLARLAAGIRERGSVPALQLHHAGIRADKGIVPVPVGPSADAATGARALSTAEVEGLRDAFVAGARRAERAGFDGVEVHGAHGYALAQFLSADTNRRDDRYGGSLENRARLLLEVVDGIRAACGPGFQLGLRLSPERFGMKLAEVRQVAAELMARDAIDYLDLSLWDAFKEPEEEGHRGRLLLHHFTDLPRGRVRLGAAGRIMAGADAARVLAEGADFALIGRAAILAYDFPARVLADARHRSPPLPVAAALLDGQGLSPAFLAYLRGFPGFIAGEVAPMQGL